MAVARIAPEYQPLLADWRKRIGEAQVRAGLSICRHEFNGVHFAAGESDGNHFHSGGIGLRSERPIRCKDVIGRMLGFGLFVPRSTDICGCSIHKDLRVLDAQEAAPLAAFATRVPSSATSPHALGCIFSFGRCQ